MKSFVDFDLGTYENKRVNAHNENSGVESLSTCRLTKLKDNRLPMASKQVANQLPMIHGSQRRDRPKSKLHAGKEVEKRSTQQRVKRSYGGAKTETQGIKQKSPATVGVGDDVQHPGAQAEAAAPRLGDGGSSASMTANGPAAQNQATHVSVAQKRKAAPTATQVPAPSEGTRKSARIAKKEPRASGETSNQATGRGKGRTDVDSVTLEHLEQVQREAQAEHDAVVMSGNAGVEKALRAVDKAVRAAAAASERTSQKLESAEAATAQQRIVVQKKLAQLLGGDAENTDDDDSDISE
ncbi:MAG: hypothetical protein Q9176_006402 [Flavoplaca citrina]